MIPLEKHDLVFCAHAMYSSPDFSGFIVKMQKYAGRRCYLALRLPPADGIIADLSMKINGSPHNSPNAIIAYNALYSIGIYANVLVESATLHWADPTLEEAFARAKRHLRLELDDSHDELVGTVKGIV